MKRKLFIIVVVFILLSWLLYHGRFFIAGNFMNSKDYKQVKNLQVKLEYSIKAEKFREAQKKGEHPREINVYSVICGGESEKEINKKLENIYKKYPLLSKFFRL